MIAAMIRKPLPEKQRQSQGVGNNYAFEVVTASSGSEKITKIGFTKGPEKRRLSRILYECQHQKIEHEEDPEHVPIRLYDKAEKLALQELSGFRYKFSCNCSVKEHREYFTVRSEVAREVVRRWREFCKQEPYDAEGKLRDFWEHRLRRMRRGEESETIHDHEKRALRWEAFVNPTDLEKIWFEFTQGFDKFWGWRWQGVAFIECCMIVVLSFPSFRAVLFFFGVVSLILAELLGFELPLTVQVVQDNFAKFQQLSRSPSLTISEMDKQNADSPTREIQAGSKSEDKELIPGINRLEDHDSALMDDESDREEKSELSVIVIPDDE
ncbi:hypothetical protein UCRPA7_5690 [Phaeoacremonium minimum UCRPA7]|uniref:Bacteriophage T5 Orf172 DNA-binding domain-containing protein n=1 Tax=Phaeoacremonium minimum (strain UCR-PA7) TaxID=1286976 RepID=R8BHK6_PHAM7|nr:hypothetical protein UCRPA7_5690 [Phaeoacremonium minimum UCRPA7]EON98791.1 hypothetical protein UCRPA7_5690 [Phaeoacremonium minimum UCRPA7]